MKRFLQVLFAMTFVLCFACMFACDNNKEEVCEHDYVAETVVEPTCTTDGYTKYKCSKCNDVKNDNVTPKLGHAMSDWVQKTPATCTEAEVLEQHCTRTGCAESDTKAGDPALGHDLKWTFVTEPTCVADGTKDGKCSRCDYEEKGVVADKLGHQMSEWAQKTPATCTEAEVLEQHCTRTGCTEYDTKAGEPALGHDYQVSTTDPEAVPATCEEGGKEVKICSLCNDRQTRDLAPLGHTSDGVQEIVTAPTCTEGGYTTYHCSVCEKDYRDDYEDPLGHNLQADKTVTASCLTDGYDLKKCSRCDYTEKENVVDKLHHSFNAEGVCENGCDMSINDKLTWVYTPLDVTYLADKDRLAMVGIDGKGQSVTNPLTISADVISKMHNEGCTSFTIKMLRSKDGQTPYFAITYGENAPKDTNEGSLEMTFDITDEMCENGVEVNLTYADNTQSNPAWGGTVIVDGFDFDIVFVKPFDINDKSMWLTGGFSTFAYSAEKDKWVVSEGDPGTSSKQSNVTIKADVFNALSAGVTSFKVYLYSQNDNQRPHFGIHDGTKWLAWYSAHPVNKPLVVEIAITDDMRTNGFTFSVAYLDDCQRPDGNPDGGTEHVTGFDMDIVFAKPFDVNDKSTWLTSGFSTLTYSAEKGKWVVGEGDPGTGSKQSNVIIKADVFKALSDDVTSFKVYLYSQNDNQRPHFGFLYGGAWKAWYSAHPVSNPYCGVVEITDDMRTNGFEFTVAYLDDCQRDGGNPDGGTEHVTGFDMDIVFVSQVTLDSSNTSYVLDGNYAYDGTVVNFNVVSGADNGAGGTYFTIGSYGVYFRGGTFRMVRKESGMFTEYSGNGGRDIASLANATFNAGVKVGLSIAVKDDATVTMTVYVNGSVAGTKDVERVADEIASEEATAGVTIAPEYVTKLVLQK